MQPLTPPSISFKHGGLDRVAIFLAILCGVHCLLTPVLLMALPFIGASFWVDANFHLWILLLVIPTTGLALFSGCRKHKDRWVLGFGALGLAILFTAFSIERVAQAQITSAQQSPIAGEATTPHATGGGCCALHPLNGEAGASDQPVGISEHALLNALGGLFLVVGHSRNFLLCRKTPCQHKSARKQKIEAHHI
ncbi:MAG: MerC domain-containing protein [Puniceicoccaceae bacterium]|nr:MAG: MerC domain-containing protein [Puniceicoccaceae bacterium]